MDYQPTLHCIHVIVNDRARLLDIRTDELHEPVPIRTSASAGVRGAFMLYSSKASGGSWTEAVVPDPEVAGESMGDASQNEEQLEEAERAETLAAKKIDKVRKEREELRRKMAELTKEEGVLLQQAGSRRSSAASKPGGFADQYVLIHDVLADRRRRERRR